MTEASEMYAKRLAAKRSAEPSGVRLNSELESVKRCPYCRVVNPQLLLLWITQKPTQRATQGPTSRWATYRCTSCGGVILAKGDSRDIVNNPILEQLFPAVPEVDDAIPKTARRYLQQAHDTLNAPDAAAVMAGSAVDAMLKAVGYKDGSLYERIDKAVAEHKLTKEMGDWAHWVRLGSNRPRHVDKDKPHVSEDEARQSVEFADALGYFLFVLNERVTKGISDAKKATESGST